MGDTPSFSGLPSRKNDISTCFRFATCSVPCLRSLSNDNVLHSGSSVLNNFGGLYVVLLCSHVNDHEVS